MSNPEFAFEKQIGDVQVTVACSENGFTISVLNKKDNDEGYIITANNDIMSINKQEWEQDNYGSNWIGQRTIDSSESRTFSEYAATPEGKKKIMDDYYDSLDDSM